jgi:hypothetical protein
VNDKKERLEIYYQLTYDSQGSILNFLNTTTIGKGTTNRQTAHTDIIENDVNLRSSYMSIPGGKSPGIFVSGFYSYSFIQYLHRYPRFFERAGIWPFIPKNFTTLLI